MKICLIANPVSGGDARLRIARAAEWLRAQGASVELLLTERSGDARRFSAKARLGSVRLVFPENGAQGP